MGNCVDNCARQGKDWPFLRLLGDNDEVTDIRLNSQIPKNGIQAQPQCF